MKEQLVELDMKEIARALADLVSANSRKALLSGEREDVFRDMFACQYPSFLYMLRNAVPSITKSEELLCILIILNQRTREMAALLCISPSSVNQARYRLRRRMGLGMNEDLNGKIKEIFICSCTQSISNNIVPF